jgi:hypothetical protein
MDIDELIQFDLSFPSTWIESTDRDWAFQSLLALHNIESLFREAVASLWKFDPITSENVMERMYEPIYFRCLNGIYAKAFVFALDGINKLLVKIKKELNPPKSIEPFISEYKNFGHLKHIRDSASHIEDRGRCKDRNGNKLNTSVIVLGGLNEKRYGFTGNDGNYYEIEISEKTLHTAKEILQEIINSYTWFQ